MDRSSLIRLPFLWMRAEQQLIGVMTMNKDDEVGGPENTPTNKRKSYSQASASENPVNTDLDGQENSETARINKLDNPEIADDEAKENIDNKIEEMPGKPELGQIPEWATKQTEPSTQANGDGNDGPTSPPLNPNSHKAI
jgi:hypothetical protein